MLLVLYFFHINKQAKHLLTAHCLLLHLVFHKAFKQVYGPKHVQKLKKNSCAISPMESYGKSMLDSLCPKSPGIHLSLLCDISAIMDTSAHRSHTFQARSLAFSLQGHQTSFFSPPQHTIFLEIWLRFKQYKISGALENARTSTWSFLYWFIDSSVLIFT